MTLRPIIIRPREAFATGATLGQDLMQEARKNILHAEHEDCALVLDAEKITAISASFLKATVFWAFLCGQAEARREKESRTDAWAVRPLKLFPMIVNCKGDVRDDVDEFFRGRSSPVLHVQKAGKIIVLGFLDSPLDRTLGLLRTAGEATAADLASKSQESISVNGWNNRLADLYLSRLVNRRREGKFWLYAPVERAVKTWA